MTDTRGKRPDGLDSGYAQALASAFKPGWLLERLSKLEAHNRFMSDRLSEAQLILEHLSKIEVDDTAAVRTLRYDACYWLKELSVEQ